METISFFCRRFGVRVIAMALMVYAAQAGPIRAQANGSGTNTPPARSSKTTTPANPDDDHFDPDDLQTFGDVVTEDRAVTVRGRVFMVHFYRPKATGPAIPAIYACGDGGWRGLAPRTALQMAHSGFAVAGVDSKIYLRRFSSPTEPLSIPQLAQDYAELAAAVRAYSKVAPDAPVYVYGWSLGAGFAVAVGSDEATRRNWAGIVAIGLPRQNQLVSGVGGNHANLKDASEAAYGFRTEQVMAALGSLPLVMIQSTTDTASPLKVGQMLYAAIQGPKQYILLKADNHRFTGAREEFYAALATAQTWIRQTRQLNGPDAAIARANGEKPVKQ